MHPQSASPNGAVRLQLALVADHVSVDTHLDEHMAVALYEKGRALDILSYRRSFAEIQRAAREVVSATMAYDVLLTPAAIASSPTPPCGT